MEYTKDELKTIVRRMEGANAQVYWTVMSVGCHPYTEFCGLLNEYAKICSEAAEQGVQFPMCNEHSGVPLPVKPYNMEYLAEKLRCIFGPTIDSDPECARILAEKLFPNGFPGAAAGKREKATA